MEDIACSANFKEKLEDLLESHGDVNKAMKNGKTLLHYFAASKGGNAAKCLNILDERGADLDFQDGLGMTALHYAAHNANQGQFIINIHYKEFSSRLAYQLCIINILN